jgi:pimeloyl-ACP methyl ester carboxylesterase
VHTQSSKLTRARPHFQIRAALLVLLTQQLLIVRIPKLLVRSAANDAALRSLARDVAASRERRKSKQTLEQAYVQSIADDDPSNWHYGAPRYALDVRAVLRRLRHARFAIMMSDMHGMAGRTIALTLLQGGAVTQDVAVGAAAAALQSQSRAPEVDAASVAEAPSSSIGIPPPPPQSLLSHKRKRSSSSASLLGSSLDGGAAAAASGELTLEKAHAEVRSQSCRGVVCEMWG